MVRKLGAFKEDYIGEGRYLRFPQQFQTNL
jgi:hypothetical protein